MLRSVVKTRDGAPGQAHDQQAERLLSVTE